MIAEERVERICKSEAVDSYKQKLFSKHNKAAVYIRTHGVTACTKPLPAQYIQNRNMERGGGHKVSHLSEKLSAIGS